MVTLTETALQSVSVRHGLCGALVAALLLPAAGCSGMAAHSSTAPSPPATSQPQAQVAPTETAALIPESEAPTSRVIHFGRESDEIPPEMLRVIDAHADFLSTHRDQRVTLAGHADERGSADYNLALAELRSQAVSRRLQLRGVDAAQLHLVGYGEERPDAAGHDESAWLKNRRVEILYSEP